MQKIKTLIVVVIVIAAAFLNQNKIQAAWRQFMRDPDIGLLILLFIVIIIFGVVRVLRS